MALLSVSELREAISTSLTDDRVQELLDAAEQDIIEVAGAVASQTEHARGGYPALALARPVGGTITSVTERADTASTLTLSANDYRVDGHLLHRLTTGDNPRSTWDGLVRVIHVPDSTAAARKRAQVALVSLELAYSKGVTGERIGDYSVQYAGAPGGRSYVEAKAEILAALTPVLVG